MGSQHLFTAVAKLKQAVLAPRLENERCVEELSYRGTLSYCGALFYIILQSCIVLHRVALSYNYRVALSNTGSKTIPVEMF